MAYYGVDTDPERLNDAIGRAGYDASYCIKWSAVRDACHDEINQIEYDPGTVGFDEAVTILSTVECFWVLHNQMAITQKLVLVVSQKFGIQSIFFCFLGLFSIICYQN